MKIVYASLTGNVKRFVSNLEFESVQIPKVGNLVVNEPFVLITYTIGFGDVPKEVVNFLRNSINKENMKAVVGSGNRNWGQNFGRGATKISSMCNVPLLHLFEISGLDSDVEIVTNKIKELEGMS